MNEIIAVFTDGTSAVYTSDALPLLLTDPDVDYFMDGETGEVYDMGVGLWN